MPEKNSFIENKVYSFKEVPAPAVPQDIFANSEFTDPLPEVEKEPEPVEKKPVWLVRGDLSQTSAVDDILELE